MINTKPIGFSDVYKPKACIGNFIDFNSQMHPKATVQGIVN